MKKTKLDKGITLIALIITIVVLLILAVVSIKAVQDGGIITHAQNAASKMNKAQIEEKANLTKLEYTTAVYTNKDLKKSVQEFRERLITAFEVTKDTNKDNIIEVNDKYAVVIKNSDLDIEVVEITNVLKASSLVSITYIMNDIEGATGEVDNTSIDFTVALTMTREEYDNLMADKNISPEEKETELLKLYGADNFDQAMLNEVNKSYNPDYTELDDFLNEKGLTRENLWYSFCNNKNPDSNYSMSKEDAVDILYARYVPDTGYSTTYLLTLLVDGTETAITDLEVDLSEGVCTFNPRVIIGPIIDNSVYELIIKDTDGNVVASEQVNVRNIVDDPTMLTKEEAKAAGWNIDYENGAIGDYGGKEKNVIIPSIVDGVKITSIGDSAFFNEDDLTSVTIPEGVTSIGRSAFQDCSSLTSITIPSSVTSIGKKAFQDCSSLTSITIPEGVTSIGEEVFRNCSNLTSITIPESVTSIGNFAFQDCTRLTSLTISEGVTSIGSNAFDHCRSLTSITIPSSVTSIGGAAFASCSSLKNIHFEGEIPTENRWWGVSEDIITPKQ